MPEFLTWELLAVVGIGFAAQVIDGALGMAFGVVSTSAMLALGMPPAQASAVVHTAEIFTTGASAASHIYHRNVDWRLVTRLGIAGVAGAVLGAWVLSNVDARKWILQENATGGDSVVWTWIRIDSESEAEIRCGLRGSVNRRAHQIGHLYLPRPQRHAHTHQRENEERGRQCSCKQQQLAEAPDTGLQCHGRGSYHEVFGL